MFSRKTFAFLEDLERNNDRDWFHANRERYERDALEPMLEFIRELEPRLGKISPYIRASDKKVGGSMMRIHRDTRFSKDKSPYSPRLGARFLHEGASKEGAIGFYIRIVPDACTLGAGIWRPDTKLVGAIRDRIVAEPRAWKAAISAKAFRDTFGELKGESLKRPPRGYDAEHPFVEDLKRKDFVGFCEWKPAAATKADFPAAAAKAYASSGKLMDFLCAALGLPF